ncbi:LysR family transcriptional regulator [Bradyrhizobium sp. BR 10289]|uniref:LysR family transcriptional regulator n=1 Tax=Bradyrhizobium sp. BR 10289 TaxID=2749993 RepID=UPI001C651812|nr:LysR family transcriptional regulator [Bradyrhizobium sp. BR 10289]MBW7970209.1 LysR family transcriptional regulator [Bradyrhizobium sp. BR 10289]
MIDLDDVRAFQKVGELLSFSEAARVLGIRKSAVSRSVQRLETALRLRLFERTTREVVLTDAGRTILNHMSEVLVRLDALLDVAAGLSSHPQGKLKLTAGIGFGTEVLTELIPEFALAYPDIAVSLDLTSRTVDLVGEQYDIAFRMGPLADSNLVATRLGAIGCTLCAAPSYLQRKGEPRSIAELATHDLLAIPRPDGLPRRWSFRDQNGNTHYLDNSPQLSANDPHAISRMVLNGAGIAAIANYSAKPEIERGDLVQVLPEWTVPAVDVSLVTPSGRERSPAMRAFVEFIRDRAVANRRWFDA